MPSRFWHFPSLLSLSPSPSSHPPRSCVSKLLALWETNVHMCAVRKQAPATESSNHFYFRSLSARLTQSWYEYGTPTHKLRCGLTFAAAAKEFRLTLSGVGCTNPHVKVVVVVGEGGSGSMASIFNGKAAL